MDVLAKATMIIILKCMYSKSTCQLYPNKPETKFKTKTYPYSLLFVRLLKRGLGNTW